MEIGLYFHIPFCASKCFYCDFLSFPKNNKQEAYIDALLSEMEQVSQSLAPGTKISTIFIGGGTPTVLPPVLLERFLGGITRYFKLTSDCEWTIEANPGTLDQEKLGVMNKYPITRISMGLQSTNDALLKKIGRRHTFKDWQESMALVRQETTWRVNADIMFALPGQTFEAFKETLETVADYNLDHLSVYALIIEEGTRFGELYDQGSLKPVSEELDREMYHYAQTFLKQRGYEQYEISNWAKQGQRCRHNKVYWTMKPYIGLGLGAHSFYGGQRFYNEEQIENYIASQGDLKKLRHQEEEMTLQHAMEEYMFLGLRMLEGISTVDFKAHFGQSVEDVYEKQLTHWKKLGLLNQQEERLFLTSYGLDVCNEVFTSFLEGETFS